MPRTRSRWMTLLSNGERMRTTSGGLPGRRASSLRAAEEPLSAPTLEAREFAAAHAGIEDVPDRRPGLLAAGAAVADAVGERARHREAVSAQRHVDQVRGKLLRRRLGRRHVPRQDALREVVDLLQAIAADAHQVALHEELLERALGGLPVPPGLRPVALRRLEVTHPERSFLADPVEHRAHELRIARPDPPFLAPPIRVHDRQGEPVVAHREERRRVRPVLERLAAPDVSVDLFVLVSGYPGPERVVVRAGDDRDRVDLHVSQPVEGLAHAGRAAAEPPRAQKTLVRQGDAPQGRRARRSGVRGHETAATRPDPTRPRGA